MHIQKTWSAIPRFCEEGLPKILDSANFELIVWQIDKKQEILKQSCKDLFIWTELPIVLFDKLLDLIIIFST